MFRGWLQPVRSVDISGSHASTTLEKISFPSPGSYPRKRWPRLDFELVTARPRGTPSWLLNFELIPSIPSRKTLHFGLDSHLRSVITLCGLREFHAGIFVQKRNSNGFSIAAIRPNGQLATLTVLAPVLSSVCPSSCIELDPDRATHQTKGSSQPDSTNAMPTTSPDPEPSADPSLAKIHSAYFFSKMFRLSCQRFRRASIVPEREEGRGRLKEWDDVCPTDENGGRLKDEERCNVSRGRVGE
jgi:hypothetical protein